MEKQTGGPAFPIGATPEEWGNGMTLRDYFAAKAMQGQMSDPNCYDTAADIASAAYRVAEAMLTERAQ